MKTIVMAAVKGCAATAVALVPALAPAQTVDEIVARHIEARGGYERIKAIQTLKIARTIATPFNDVKVVMYRKRPALLRVEQGPAGQPAVPRGVTADSAWDVVQGKVVPRPAHAFPDARDIDADFDGYLVDWKEKGHAVAFEGRESLPGGDVLKLKVTTRGGTVRYVYLDARTYLDRRHTGVFTIYHPADRARDRQFNVVLDFGGWREVNGVKFPFDITEERTGKEPVQSYAIYTEKIEANVPMDDALFAPPAK
jgi:hypothetical protein